MQEIAEKTEKIKLDDTKVESEKKSIFDTTEPAYNKNDFFDKISCDTLDKINRPSRPQQSQQYNRGYNNSGRFNNRGNGRN